MARAAGPTKQELQESIDEVAEKVEQLLDPILTREQLVEGLQEIDSLISGEEDEDDDNDDPEDE
jgi:hypothetical protein